MTKLSSTKESLTKMLKKFRRRPPKLPTLLPRRQRKPMSRKNRKTKKRLKVWNNNKMMKAQINNNPWARWPTTTTKISNFSIITFHNLWSRMENLLRNEFIKMSRSLKMKAIKRQKVKIVSSRRANKTQIKTVTPAKRIRRNQVMTKINLTSSKLWMLKSAERKVIQVRMTSSGGLEINGTPSMRDHTKRIQVRLGTLLHSTTQSQIQQTGMTGWKTLQALPRKEQWASIIDC